MRATDRTGLAVTVSVLLAVLTVRPLTADQTFLGLGALLVVLLGVLTVGLRRARVGNGAVLAAQLVVVAGFSLLLGLSLPGTGAPWFEHYPPLWLAGIDHMRTQGSPMDPSDGVTLIFVTVIGLIMVMTDLLVEGIHRPAWAIAPPATLFLVPALGMGTDTGLFPFLCVAVGYLGILVAGGLNSSARWTRGLSRDSADGEGTATPVVWRAAGYLAGPAVLVTLLLGAAVPTMTLPGFGLGGGTGGDGPLQLTDPTLDLKRNLTQPTDRTVIEYTTDKPGGVYLRLASLPQFSAAGWTNVQIRLNDGDALPNVPGLAEEPAEQRTTNIRVRDFGSQYLPMPYAPRAFDADGDWRYDANSLVVVNSDDDARALRNLSYAVQSVDVAPDPELLAETPAGSPVDASITSDVPDDLPERIVELSRQVSEDATTPAAKAAAIQAYLRSDEFTYSTAPRPGNGYQAVENFLFEDQTGYCEQFASSMALMARIVGIPSRVSVGFLPGQLNGDTWSVGIQDMHAWPELYFAGYGWVRFEPTPAAVTGTAPAWTVPERTTNETSPSASASASASATAPTASTEPSTAPSEQPTTTGVGSTFPWARTLLGGGAGLLVLLVLAAPATIRIRRRSSRLGGGSGGPSGGGMDETRVEAAWAEIRDTVLDYGGSWPDGSPRRIGTEIGNRLDETPSASMGQVATLVERSRYSRGFVDPDGAREIPQLTEEIRRGIAGPAGPGRKLLAFVLPLSIFRRPPSEDGPAR